MTDTPDSSKPTMAVQDKVSVGTTIVGIWNLHVAITCDDRDWFAQGYEIDYAACGTSLDDVKKRFQNGLAATIHEHLTLFGTIESLLVPAPPEAWKTLAGAAQHTYSQVRAHELFPDQEMLAAFPFSGIEYSSAELEPRAC